MFKIERKNNMTMEECGSGLLALEDWLEREGLLGKKAKECLSFAIDYLLTDKSNR